MGVHVFVSAQEPVGSCSDDRGTFSQQIVLGAMHDNSLFGYCWICWKSTVKYRGSTRAWISAHLVVSQDFKFPEKPEQAPTFRLGYLIKREAQDTKLNVPVCLQSLFHYWHSYLLYNVTDFLTFQMSGHFCNPRYRRMCYTDTRDKVHPSHWLQCLYNPCSSDPAHFASRLICFTTFHISRLSCCCLSQSCIFFECRWGNHSWWHANMTSRFTHQSTMQCVAISKIVDTTIQVWCASNRLH